MNFDRLGSMPAVLLSLSKCYSPITISGQLITGNISYPTLTDNYPCVCTDLFLCLLQVEDQMKNFRNIHFLRKDGKGLFECWIF